MALASDYPFLDVFWTMLIFFLWIAGSCCCSTSSPTSSGVTMRAVQEDAWLIFLLFVPFLGTFVYLIANGNEMAQRNVEGMAKSAGPDGRVRPVGRRLGRSERDREGEGAARQRRHQSAGVRRDQGQGRSPDLRREHSTATAVWGWRWHAGSRLGTRPDPGTFCDPRDMARATNATTSHSDRSLPASASVR